MAVARRTPRDPPRRRGPLTPAPVRGRAPGIRPQAGASAVQRRAGMRRRAGAVDVVGVVADRLQSDARDDLEHRWLVEARRVEGLQLRVVDPPALLDHVAGEARQRAEARILGVPSRPGAPRGPRPASWTIPATALWADTQHSQRFSAEAAMITTRCSTGLRDDPSNLAVTGRQLPTATGDVARTLIRYMPPRQGGSGLLDRPRARGRGRARGRQVAGGGEPAGLLVGAPEVGRRRGRSPAGRRPSSAARRTASGRPDTPSLR